MNHKIILYGSTGFIGSNIKKYINVIDGKARCDSYLQLKEEIELLKPDRVICCIGRSYDGNGIESNLEINTRDNLLAKLNILKVCNDNDIHFTHIGDGSLYHEEEITDNSYMNFYETSHSTIKVNFEKYLSTFDNILNIRLFNPISNDNDPRSFLMKIISYNKVINKNISISILDSVIPLLKDMILNSTVGQYNLCNKGFINLLDLKLKYKTLFDSTLEVNEYPLIEHDKEIGRRSHVVVINNKLKTDNLFDSLDILFSKLLTKCRKLDVCLCCRSQNKILLDLGYQPLANDFHELNVMSEVYPLKLMYCETCFHCQLSHAVNPEILFRNYKYVSGTSQTGLNFFRDNAKFINDMFSKPGKILDIACNDGSQLDYFKQLGWDTYGVDPAENLCPIAEQKGHTILCDFWNENIAKRLPIMDVITAQNVFAHTEFIDKFLQDSKIIMDDNTKLFIQTSQRDMIRNGEFDTTYHEHISFYNSLSMKTLVERNGLNLNNVYHPDIHGGSYIFEISKVKIEGNIEEVMRIERDNGLYGIYLYENFRLNAIRSIYNVRSLINKYKGTHKIIGFGAAAKGQTFICYGNIKVDYIIDENPLKIGTYSPKLNIPIVSPNHFRDDLCSKYLIIILAWNFAKEIVQKINKIKGGKEVLIISKYFPEIEIN